MYHDLIKNYALRRNLNTHLIIIIIIIINKKKKEQIKCPSPIICCSPRFKDVGPATLPWLVEGHIWGPHGSHANLILSTISFTDYVLILFSCMYCHYLKSVQFAGGCLGLCVMLLSKLVRRFVHLHGGVSCIIFLIEVSLMCISMEKKVHSCISHNFYRSFLK